MGLVISQKVIRHFRKRDGERRSSKPVGRAYLKLENVLDTVKLLLEPVERRGLAIEPSRDNVRPH